MRNIAIIILFALTLPIVSIGSSVVKGLLLYPEDGATNPTIQTYVDGTSDPFIDYDVASGEWRFSNDGVEALALGSGSGAGGSRLNLIKDPSFENEESNGTCSGCSITYSYHGVISDELLTPTNERYLSVGGGGPWTFTDTYSTNSSYQGQPGLFYIYAKYGGEGMSISTVIDGVVGDEVGVNKLNIIPTLNPRWKIYELPFVFGSSSAGYQISYSEATNATIKIDEVYVGLQPAGYIQSINDVDTDWITYTPTFSGITASSSNFEYKRDGDSLWIKGKATLDAAATGQIEIGLPNSLIVEETTTDRSMVVQGYDNSASQFHSGFAQAPSGQDVVRVIDDASVGTWDAAVPFTWASGDVLHIPPTLIKIKGWETGRTNVTQQRQREPVVSGFGNGNENLTSSTDIPFAEVEDTTDSWDGSKFTAPVGGSYIISGVVLFDSNVSVDINAYVDGVNTKNIGVEGSVDNNHVFNGVVRLDKGQDLSIRIGTTAKLLNSSAYHNIHIQRVPDWANLAGYFNETQINKNEDKFVTTETEWGKWNGKQLYRRCFEVAADITTSGTVIANWGAGLNPKGLLSRDSGFYDLLYSTDANSTSYLAVVYNQTDGDVEVYMDLTIGTFDGLMAGTSFCMEYTK